MRVLHLVAAVVVAAALAGTMPAHSQGRTLKVSHQFPSGDARDEGFKIFAEEIKKANVGLDVRVYPGASLYKPAAQWDALISGQLDVTMLLLDYVSGRHPEFGVTIMPFLVRNYEHGKRLSASPFMERFRTILEAQGVIQLADTWQAVGFGSKDKCIVRPEDVDGLVMRGIGPYFEGMLKAAGASVTSMPNNEVYTALQTGVLNALATGTLSMTSFNLQEQLSCATPPGDQGIGFAHQPILISKRTFDALNDKQKSAVQQAARVAIDHIYKAFVAGEEKFIKIFKQANAEVVFMSEEDRQKWVDLARKTSYVEFDKRAPRGKELLDLAAEVE